MEKRLLNSSTGFTVLASGRFILHGFDSTVLVPSSQSLSVHLCGGEGRGEQWVRRHDGQKTFGKAATSKCQRWDLPSIISHFLPVSKITYGVIKLQR